MVSNTLRPSLLRARGCWLCAPVCLHASPSTCAPACLLRANHHCRPYRILAFRPYYHRTTPPPLVFSVLPPAARPPPLPRTTTTAMPISLTPSCRRRFFVGPQPHSCVHGRASQRCLRQSGLRGVRGCPDTLLRQELWLRRQNSLPEGMRLVPGRWRRGERSACPQHRIPLTCNSADTIT